MFTSPCREPQPDAGLGCVLREDELGLRASGCRRWPTRCPAPPPANPTESSMRRQRQRARWAGIPRTSTMPASPSDVRPHAVSD